ncbi:MAG TPA: DUF4157 domain-containing protein [Niabella sp.]|nr:DUF4157 domain-containing protein [Niabella sp.]HRB60241.1 DUF4157 domain-containing protein [Niabella sp.]HRB61220.1 DUF4157 domain-containing protein [Niabella sp.]HRB87991.1 DUF4157 domain-containing protein [Niabella sp.]
MDLQMKADYSIANNTKHSGINKSLNTKKETGFDVDKTDFVKPVSSDIHFMNLPILNAIQTKLTINEPGDKYEQEADAMADKVMRMEMPASFQSFSKKLNIQRKCAHCEEEKEETLQRKELSGQTTTAQNSLDSYVGSLNTSGQPLTKETRNFYEPRLGYDFGKVKIHNDTSAAQSAQSINALAYTHGNNIVFNTGKYAPQSHAGKRLLGHELVHVMQQGNNIIQRESMPDETTVSDLTSYSKKTRQNIRYDNGFNLQSKLSLYFQKGIVLDAKKDYNVSFAVKGFDATEAWLETPLKALALYNFNLSSSSQANAIINLTTVQHLDMTNQENPSDTKIKGPDILVRFTSTEFDTTKKGSTKTKNVQLMIERMGAFSASTSSEKPADRKKRYESKYQITNALPVRNDPLGDPPETMDDARFDLILQALDKVPESILNQGKGIPIHRGLKATGPNGEGAEYTQTKAKGSDVWERRITVYADFFSKDIDARSFLMAHEFGHALDFRPNESSKGKGGPSLSAAVGKDSFKRALKLDGGVKKGVSTYSLTQTEEKEYFAEAFTMYINQPETLKVLRPNVYEYFHTKYP